MSRTFINPSAHPSPPPSPPRLVERHELHRAVDGDWSSEGSAPVASQRELVMGLAVVAALPLVAMLLPEGPDAPRELVAAVASLPLVALLCAALTWRSTGGRP